MVPAFSLPGAISFTDALSRGSRQPMKAVSVSGQDLAFIQYTGGTTGVSKGAMLTHRNIIANVEAQDAWMKPATNSSNGDPEVLVAALPLYHVYALTVNALAALKTGAMNLLITNPRDLNAFIDDLKKYKITTMTGVNTLYNGLLNHPRIGEVDFSHLKITSAGGMALQNSSSRTLASPDRQQTRRRLWLIGNLAGFVVESGRWNGPYWYHRRALAKYRVEINEG